MVVMKRAAQRAQCSVASSLEKASRTISPSSPPAKRSRRSDRSVNGIDQVLDPANFAQMELPPPSRKTYVGYLGPRKKKNTEKIMWMDASPNPQGCQCQCDIISDVPGLKSRQAKSVETMREAFDLFFSEEMMDLLLWSMNLKIEQTLSQQPQEMTRDHNSPQLRSVSSMP